MIVVDKKQQRTLSRRGTEQVQDRGVHCPPVAGSRVGEHKSRAQGPGLACRKRIDAVFQRPKQIGDGNEGQVRL